MSAYGPALFVTRKDKKPLTKTEQQSIVKLVASAAKTLKLKDDEDKPVAPRFYNYGSYEPNGVGVLLFSGYIYSMMPAHIQQDENQIWELTGKKLGKEIEKTHPKAYTFKCYYVED
jgi:hypothetical protein